MHSVSVGEGLLLEFSIGEPEWRWDDWSWSTHGNLLLAATDHQHQTAHTGSTNSITTVVDSEVAPGKGHAKTILINIDNSAHDFSVKLSPCVCSHTDSSCPGCLHMWCQAISGEELSRYLLMYDKPTMPCAMTNQFAAWSGLPHND